MRSERSVNLLNPRGDDYAKPPTWWRKALRWADHHSGRMLVGTVAAFFVLQMLRAFEVVSEYPDYVMDAVVVVLLVALRQSERHYGKWCERCLGRRLVESGREAADKDVRMLYFWHWRNGCRWHVGPLHLSRSTPLLLLVPSLTVLSYDNPVVGMVFYPLWLVWTVAAARSGERHGWHGPFCRYCRRGGGEDYTEPVPDPTPDPTAVGPIPVGT